MPSISNWDSKRRKSQLKTLISSNGDLNAAFRNFDAAADFFRSGSETIWLSHLVLVLSWMSSLCFIILLSTSVHLEWRNTLLFFFRAALKRNWTLSPWLQKSFNAFCSIKVRSKPDSFQQQEWLNWTQKSPFHGTLLCLSENVYFLRKQLRDGLDKANVVLEGSFHMMHTHHKMQCYSLYLRYKLLIKCLFIPTNVSDNMFCVL